MNLYIRYFDKEILVHTADEAIDFLSRIEEVGMNPLLEGEVRDYIKSDSYYPKKYKVRPRAYFIIIKTEAATMADFKAKKALHATSPVPAEKSHTSNSALSKLTEVKPGWYEGVILFKRVMLVPGTGKYQYKDTCFVARCKAQSGMDCYRRIVDHLSQRVDKRSQFPSVKGKNFRFSYLGQWK